MPKQSPRNQQPATSGLGRLFTSPRKRYDKFKSHTLVAPLGQSARRHRLDAQLKALQHDTDDEVANVLDVNKEDFEPPAFTFEDSSAISGPVPPPGLPSCITSTTPRHVLPDNTTRNLYQKWDEVLSKLVDPLLTFINTTCGQITHPTTTLETTCISAICERKTGEILCLLQNYFQKIPIVSCACQNTLYILITNGLFPTSPTHPRMAVSIFLLEFYNALFERSSDAINALAQALSTFYIRRGFIPLNKKGQPIADAFRRGLGYAVQWYDNLRTRLESRVQVALQAADKVVQGASPHQVIGLSDGEGLTQTHPGLVAGECSRILRQRCPLCFGGRLFGRSLEQGGDFQVSTDGNFNHRHNCSAGDCPHFYEPEYFLPKKQVDAVGERIETLRKSTAKSRKPPVPDEAIDDCASSHTAGSGSNSKTNMEQFDDGGVMVLVCRHDIPLFFANIDTPGEQQKYAVALIEHLCTLVPPQATAGVLYDVGCVLERSLQMYDILPDSVTDRLIFATTAMHAYAHQWSCQLVYNPRIRTGFGLTDGEGTERLWSRMQRLIGITQASARSRRIWLLDRQAAAIGQDMRDDLGNWIRRRLERGVVGQEQSAQGTLRSCEIPIETLREQWELQKAAQLSIHAHAPARLKHELNTVLSLQSDLDTVDAAIQATSNALSKTTPSKDSLQLLTSLEATHETLKEKVEALYSSLNVQDSFPELQHQQNPEKT